MLYFLSLNKLYRDTNQGEYGILRGLGLGGVMMIYSRVGMQWRCNPFVNLIKMDSTAFALPTHDT